MGAGGPIPSTTAAPAEEKKVEAKTEESEESDDDMGFGLFHLTSLVTHSVKTSLKKKKQKTRIQFPVQGHCLVPGHRINIPHAREAT